MNPLSLPKHNIATYIHKHSGAVVQTLQLPQHPEQIKHLLDQDTLQVLEHGKAVCRVEFEANCPLWANNPAWKIRQPGKHQYIGSPGSYILWIKNTVYLLPKFTFENHYELIA